VLLGFTGAQVFFNIIKLISGLLVVRLVIPEIYGALIDLSNIYK
jgi:hypothetical protein